MHRRAGQRTATRCLPAQVGMLLMSAIFKLPVRRVLPETAGGTPSKPNARYSPASIISGMSHLSRARVPDRAVFDLLHFQCLPKSSRYRRLLNPTLSESFRVTPTFACSSGSAAVCGRRRMTRQRFGVAHVHHPLEQAESVETSPASLVAAFTPKVSRNRSSSPNSDAPSDKADCPGINVVNPLDMDERAKTPPPARVLYMTLHTEGESLNPCKNRKPLKGDRVAPVFVGTRFGMRNIRGIPKWST